MSGCGASSLVDVVESSVEPNVEQQQSQSPNLKRGKGRPEVLLSSWRSTWLQRAGRRHRPRAHLEQAAGSLPEIESGPADQKFARKLLNSFFRNFHRE